MKGNGRNKENAIEIIDADEDSQLDQQKKRNVLEQVLLNSKQKNDDLKGKSC